MKHTQFYGIHALQQPAVLMLTRSSSHSWNPAIRTLHPVRSTGHKILRISMQLKPSVVNNPKDPKHEVLPTDLFMPGRHPSAAKQADIQALIRLIHREVQSDPQCSTCYKSLT